MSGRNHIVGRDGWTVAVIALDGSSAHVAAKSVPNAKRLQAFIQTMPSERDEKARAIMARALRDLPMVTP